MPSINTITSTLESWAPRGMQQTYDNVGLQVGDPDAVVDTAVIALDLTPAIADEAIAQNAQLIITHHPLIFRPLKSVTTRDWHGSLILKLAQAGIALYCIHTNLDAAKGGVSFALAQQLGLRDIGFLKPMDNTLVKLVSFVPRTHTSGVRAALADAGAGRIGEYDACAFVGTGTGYFKPGENTAPHTGTAGGGITSADENRIEVEVQRWDLPRVLRALHQAHPYEEVAYDVYPLENAGTRTGMGAIGNLSDAEPLDAFLQRVSSALSTSSLRFVGDASASIQRVAVCGGSGSDLTDAALRAGADAFLTADITYHRFFDVLDTAGEPRMALIDAMHYETEACTESLLQNWLNEKFPDVNWHKTSLRTSPVQAFTGP